MNQQRSAFPDISRVYLVALGELTLATAQLRQLSTVHRDADPAWTGRADQLLGFTDRLDAAIAERPGHESDIRVLMPDGSLVAGDQSYVEQLTRRIVRHVGIRRSVDVLISASPEREQAMDEPVSA
ncbi:MAG: hypothetical protein HY996_04740 [Micrococcales bacterium]|nr:hypothetical protein [Micrococcales bacterium]